MRKILFLLIILNVFLLTACGGDQQGVTPTHDFSINGYYQDNCIILQNEKFVIDGVSEPGVLLKAELYNSSNKKVLHASSIADMDGKFNLTFSAPSASYESYKLIINDSVNTKEINNIRFGEVLMLAGEHFDDFNYEYKSECENVSFYIFENGIYSWETQIDNTETNYIEFFAKQLSEQINMPVGIINATLENGCADSWLSYETASKHLRIKNYLINTKRYIESDENIVLKSDNLSSMYQTFIKPLKDVKIRGIIWNQGLSELNDQFIRNSKDYSYLLMILFSELQSFFENKITIFSLQAKEFGDNNYNLLRIAQAIPTFQVKNVNIIPTYDCYEVDEEVLFNNEMFNERMVKSITNDLYQRKDKYTAISYNNIVVNLNTYEIYFEKDLLESEELIGFVVKDEFDNDLEYSHTIEKNCLIITLEDEEARAKYLYYGFGDNIYENNLKTDAGTPIIPFIIELDVESVRK